MADELQGKKIAILAADGVEQVELEQPREAVQNAGAQTELLSLDTGEIQAMNADINRGDKISVDKRVADASVDDYDGLIIPGGTLNPDNMRQDPDAVGFVQEWFKSGKPVGMICHGPWMLVEADIARGRTVTSFPSIRTDLQRRRERRRRGGRGRRGSRHEPQSRRPAGVLRQAGRGDRRGRAPRARRGGHGSGLAAALRQRPCSASARWMSRR